MYIAQSRIFVNFFNIVNVMTICGLVMPNTNRVCCFRVRSSLIIFFHLLIDRIHYFIFRMNSCKHIAALLVICVVLYCAEAAPHNRDRAVAPRQRVKRHGNVEVTAHLTDGTSVCKYFYNSNTVY